MVAASASDTLVTSLPKNSREASATPCNGERPPLAEVHLVQIQLQDLVLGGARLQHHREPLLLQLAFEGLLRRQKEVLHQLLRNGAGADQVALGAADVGDDGPDDADGIDAGVFVEPFVFDGEYRLHHVAWNQCQRHPPALLPAGGDERCQQRRLEDPCQPHRRRRRGRRFHTGGDRRHDRGAAGHSDLRRGAGHRDRVGARTCSPHWGCSWPASP